MINKKFIIRLFLTTLFLIILYSLTRCSMFAISDKVKADDKEVSCITVKNPPMSIPKIIEVKTQKKQKKQKKKIEYKNWGKFKLTGYCRCSKCCGKSDGITATGTKAKANRTIAVDPSKIPYGSFVKINGEKYVAEDCGGAIKNNRIDIFFDSHKDALEFGVKYANVKIKVR